MLYRMQNTATPVFHVWDVMYLRSYAQCATREQAERLAQNYQLRLGRHFDVRDRAGCPAGRLCDGQGCGH